VKRPKPIPTERSRLEADAKKLAAWESKLRRATRAVLKYDRKIEARLRQIDADESTE
jgi:hypothetical protein